MTDSEVELKETSSPNAIEKGEEPKPQELAKPEKDEPRVKLSRRQFVFVWSGLLLGLFLSSIDQTIVSTALPNIVSDFGRMDLYSWVIVSYLLTSTTVVPLCGKFSDLFGRKTLYQGAVVFFIVGSILCAVAPNMISLIIFRALQGIGGGAINSLNQIIIVDIVTVRERGKYSGLNGMVFAVSSVLGPLLGGVLTDKLSWRWCFYVNIPFGVIAFIIMQFNLNIPRSNNKKKRELLGEIDFIGTALFVVGIVLILLGVSLGGETFPWRSAEIIVFFILGGAILGFFVYYEYKWAGKHAIFAIRQFKDFTISVCSIGVLCIGWGMMGAINYIPVFFQVIQHQNPTISGLKIIPMMVALVICVMGAGNVIAKTLYSWPFPPLGCALACIGFGCMYLIESDWDYGHIVGPIIVIGMGIGFSLQTLMITAQFSAPPGELAVTTAMIIFGGTVGVAIFGAILTSGLKSRLDPELAAIASAGVVEIYRQSIDIQLMIVKAYTESLRVVFVSVVPLYGISLFLTLTIHKGKLVKKSAVINPTENKEELVPTVQVES